MTNHLGDRVRLSIADRLTIIGLVLGHLVLVGGIAIGMWTRLAVLEAKVERQTLDINELRRGMEE
jgi:hypothetical protein